jgi:hypothetical protein
VDFDELLSGAAFGSLVILAPLILALVLAEVARRPSRERATHRCGQPDRRALALLKEWLSPAQLAQYESKGHFEVTGSHSGKRYRIRRGGQMNIDELDERGTRVAVWCFGPEGQLPAGDVMLAQKIALETEEQAALTVGNRSH